MAYAPYVDEAEYAAYLHRTLDRNGFATAIGWSVVGASYADVVNEALRRHGTLDITTVTVALEIAMLNAYGRAELWRQVMEATFHERDTRLADTSSADMSQIYEHASEQYALAEQQIETLTGGGLKVHVTTLRPTHDPYREYES